MDQLIGVVLLVVVNSIYTLQLKRLQEGHKDKSNKREKQRKILQTSLVFTQLLSFCGLHLVPAGWSETKFHLQ